MKGAKEFFEDMREGDEYHSLLATKEVYFSIDFELREQMYSSNVRQKNSSFKDDPNHQQLVLNSTKASKELREYEYIINQGKKSK